MLIENQSFNKPGQKGVLGPQTLHADRKNEDLDVKKDNLEQKEKAGQFGSRLFHDVQGHVQFSTRKTN